MRWTVLGAGSWGTALALHLDRAGHEVRLWARSTEAAELIREARRNDAYLPGIDLPRGLAVESDLEACARAAEAVAVAIPSEFCRALYARLRGHIAPGCFVVSATKGIETDSLLRMTQVAGQEIAEARVAVVSGPSFALEVAREQPTAVVVAAADDAVAEEVQHALATPNFRVYASDDVVGVELGGALKNVVAIAAGILDGLGLGSNTLAALVTRGLAEISRLSLALGGRAETLAGLAGLGDLVLTCTGALSRNRRLGQELGRGAKLAEALPRLSGNARGRMVAEGVRTTLAACELAERTGVEMPITLAMRDVLHRGTPVGDAIEALMLRTLKRE